jgi:chromosome segregation ATPase
MCVAGRATRNRPDSRRSASEVVTVTSSATDERTLQERVAAMELSGDAEELLHDLLDELQQARADAENAELMARRAVRKTSDLRADVAALEDDLTTVEAENQRLREELAEMQRVGDILNDVTDQTSESIKDVRARKLIVTLLNDAIAGVDSDNEKVQPRAAMDYNGANRALGGGFEDKRTLLYQAMRRAVELTNQAVTGDADEGPAEYVSESRSSDRNTRVTLDLSDESVIPAVKSATPTGGDSR